MARKIKIGDTVLPETIILNEVEARLIIFPMCKKWKMQYVTSLPRGFTKFSADSLSFSTIEEAAMSMRTALKFNGFIK